MAKQTRSKKKGKKKTLRGGFTPLEFGIAGIGVASIIALGLSIANSMKSTTIEIINDPNGSVNHDTLDVRDEKNIEGLPSADL